VEPPASDETKGDGKMNTQNNKYNVNSAEVQAILSGVIRGGSQSYYRINPDGQHAIVAIRRELMSRLSICSKSATKLLKAACIPYAAFIHNEQQQPPEPEADPQAMMEAALEAATKEAEREEKIAKKLEAEEASIRKRYSLVRQGSYHGVYNEETGSQELFHTVEEAREYLTDLIHGRDSFRAYYGSVTNRRRSPELQEVGY
jgi:hypothetical protein